MRIVQKVKLRPFRQYHVSVEVKTDNFRGTPEVKLLAGNSGLNYAVTFTPATTGAINKALLTITANNQTLFVGGTDPAYTASYSGLMAGETSAVLDAAPVCGVSVPHTAVGNYPILCSGAAYTDYSFSYVNGTLTVTYAHINVDINGVQQGTGADYAVGASDTHCDRRAAGLSVDYPTRNEHDPGQ